MTRVGFRFPVIAPVRRPRGAGPGRGSAIGRGVGRIADGLPGDEHTHRHHQWRLQAAVNVASPGDRLTVKGTCHGITTIDRDLRITGIRTATSGQPTLDGDDAGGVVEVRYSGLTVTVKTLSIMDGRGTFGGGIVNRGTLVLRDVVGRGNRAGAAGGPRRRRRSGERRFPRPVRRRADHRTNASKSQGGGVVNYGVLTLNDSSSISGDRATSNGGGAYNGGTLTLNGSATISSNDAYNGAGVDNWRTLTLNGSAKIATTRPPAVGAA